MMDACFILLGVYDDDMRFWDEGLSLDRSDQKDLYGIF